MEDHINTLAKFLGEDKLHRDVDVSEFLHTRLGTKIKAFYIATNLHELIKIINLCWELKIDFLLIGTGSKAALSLQGFPGLIIKNATNNIKIAGIKGKISQAKLGVEEVLIEAESGVSLIKLAEFVSKQNLTGLETFHNIPGSIGGSIYFMPTLQAKCQSVKVLEKNGQISTKNISQLTRDDLICSAVFKLKAKLI